MNFKKIFNPDKLSTILLYTSIITFIIAFNFSDNPPVSGWKQQFMPNLNNRPLSDVQFIDSLVGYGITGDHTGGDTNYVIKTTNGGDNWVIINTIYKDLSRIKFINANTGYVCGGLNGIPALFIKTTNGGMNWFDINGSLRGRINDIFVLNEDTIWFTEEAGLVGGLFRTTDGGSSWIRQFYANGNIPARIYMLNSQTGFFSSSGESFLNKTTDGGFNWTVINGEDGFYYDMYFIDSLTGWKAKGNIKKTTNGGLNWTIQALPTGAINGGIILGPYAFSFSNINNDTIWSDGGQVFYGAGRFRGILFRTTNGGANWLYQIPDTSFGNQGYGFVQFINKNVGWASAGNFSGIHTLVGGDSTFLTKIKTSDSKFPNSYLLGQNYPNPFNPKTVINYELPASRQGGRVTRFVSLRIYNIQGEETKILVNQKQNSGEYKIEFDGSDLPSGVYFYSLFLDGERVDTKKMMLLK